MGRLLRPLRGRGSFSALAGGVASLNPRLMAGNPPGCNRSAFLARQDLCITMRAPAWEPLYSSSSLPWLGKQSFKNRVPKQELGNAYRLGFFYQQRLSLIIAAYCT
jgi:hypothetical protein